MKWQHSKKCCKTKRKIYSRSSQNGARNNNLRIVLRPENATSRSLSGSLFVDGSFECYFLTLPKGDGLPGSAIPPGLYSVRIAPSPKFEAIAEHDAWFKLYADHIPHLMGIPNRSNILIHPGNYPDQTNGCILVGNSKGIDYLANSRAAFASLQPKIVAACSSALEGCELEMQEMASNHDTVMNASLGEA